MSQLSPADIKPHLFLATDYAGDDVRLQGLIDAAETAIVKHLRRDLDADFPTGWPADIIHAVKVYVAHLDQSREPGEEVAQKHGLPAMVADMVAPYRDMCA